MQAHFASLPDKLCCCANAWAWNQKPLWTLCYNHVHLLSNVTTYWVDAAHKDCDYCVGFEGVPLVYISPTKTPHTSLIRVQRGLQLQRCYSVDFPLKHKSPVSLLHWADRRRLLWMREEHRAEVFYGRKLKSCKQQDVLQENSLLCLSYEAVWQARLIQMQDARCMKQSLTQNYFNPGNFSQDTKTWNTTSKSPPSQPMRGKTLNRGTHS